MLRKQQWYACQTIIIYFGKEQKSPGRAGADTALFAA
jgi:hypothetical protein